MNVPSVLSRYVVREILLHVLGVLAIVLGIFLLRRFAGLLTDAAEGALPPNVILHLLGLRTIMALPSLLPVVLYLAILLALGRLHQDQEMTALNACGVGPGRVRAIVLSFALLVAGGIGALSYSTRPWAANELQVVGHRAAREVSADSISPGRFYELGGEAEQVVFAEARSRTNSQILENVFVQYRKGNELSILYSDEALVHRDEQSGYRFLRLLDGYRYDLRPDRREYEITNYEEFVIRTPVETLLPEEGAQKARPTSELFGSSDLLDEAELQWRLSMPVSALILAFLAIPLSRVEPRQGKYGKLLLAILIYTVYRQLLSTSKNWVADGDLAAFPGMWVVHALCFGVATYFYLRGAEKQPSVAPWLQTLRAAHSGRAGERSRSMER